MTVTQRVGACRCVRGQAHENKIVICLLCGFGWKEAFSGSRRHCKAVNQRASLDRCLRPQISEALWGNRQWG